MDGCIADHSHLGAVRKRCREMEATADFRCARGFVGLPGCNPNDSLQGKQHLPPRFAKLEKMEGICQRPHQQRRHQRRPRQPDSEALLPHWVLSGFSHCEPGATNLERQTEEKQSDHVVPDPPEKHTRKGVRGQPSQSVRGGTSADILAVRTYESFQVMTAGEL